jgi:hypothetical protein
MVTYTVPSQIRDSGTPVEGFVNSRHRWNTSSGIGYTLCGFSPVHGDTIAVLEAYIDESGSHDDNLLVIAAYISQVERWVSFSQEWKKILTNYSLVYFHMKDFRNPKSRAYRHLTVRDKEDLLGALIDVIHRHVLFGVSFLTSPRWYDQCTTPAYRNRHDSCYSMSVHGCLAVAFRLLHRLDAGTETVGIFVEEGHKNDREVIETLGELKRQTDPFELPDDLDGIVSASPFLDIPKDDYSGEEDPFFQKGVKVGAYGLGSKRTMLPLQAADIFAYCARDVARRPDAYFCKGVMRKLRSRIPHYRCIYDKKLILNLVERVEADELVRGQQRRNCYVLKQQLRNFGFDVEEVRSGLSVRGNRFKMAWFFRKLGLKRIAGV